MITCTICGNRISGTPYICQPDGTYIHRTNSNLCSPCFRAWCSDEKEYLVKAIKEKLGKVKE